MLHDVVSPASLLSLSISVFLSLQLFPLLLIYIYVLSSFSRMISVSFPQLTFSLHFSWRYS
jgi:hypothetical protein